MNKRQVEMADDASEPMEEDNARKLNDDAQHRPMKQTDHASEAPAPKSRASDDPSSSAHHALQERFGGHELNPSVQPQGPVTAAAATAAPGNTSEASKPAIAAPATANNSETHHSVLSLAAVRTSAADSPVFDGSPHSGSRGAGSMLHGHHEHAGGSTKQHHAAHMFVPRKDASHNIPCFTQTSALAANMCGYCGTRTTSGCWRRGWEIGPGRFINLCNKCGLRHKAGKLPSVPEPPPPQLRGRAAAAAAASGGGGSGPAGYDHSGAASDLMHLMAAGGSSPDHSTGQAAAHSDPVAAAAAPRKRGNGGGGNNSAGRHRQQPLAPKASRVGTNFGDYSQEQQLLAQLMAANGGSSNYGGSSMAAIYSGFHGGAADEQQQQQQLAAMLQSLVEGTSSAGAGSFQHAGGATGFSSSYPAAPAAAAPPLMSGRTAGDHGSSSHLLGYFDYGHNGGMAGLAGNVHAGASAAQSDTAQAVAAVLAAAAAAAASGPAPANHSHNSSLGFGSPLQLNPLSGQREGGTTPALDASQMSSPATKKRRIKKDSTAADKDVPDAAGTNAAPLAGSGNQAAMVASVAAEAGSGAAGQQPDDAAAAGDAADALLALHRCSANPSPDNSPSAARRQAAAAAALAAQTVVPKATAVLSPRLTCITATDMNGNRQITSPSIDTKTSSLAQYLQPMHSPHHHTHQAQMLLAPQAPSSPLAAALPVSRRHMPHQPQHTSVVANWTPERLQAWLHSAGCGEAVGAFRALGIDGVGLSGLLRVTSDAGAARLDERLKADLGVEQVGLRLRLVERMMMELVGGSSSGGGHSSKSHAHQ